MTELKRCKHGMIIGTCGMCANHKFLGKIPPGGYGGPLSQLFSRYENENRHRRFNLKVIGYAKWEQKN